jgi:hypothetical protein
MENKISDKIDGAMFNLPLDEKIKLWELIELLVEERMQENEIKCSICGSVPSLCYVTNSGNYCEK